MKTLAELQKMNVTDYPEVLEFIDALEDIGSTEGCEAGDLLRSMALIFDGCRGSYSDYMHPDPRFVELLLAEIMELAASCLESIGGRQ